MGSVFQDWMGAAILIGLIFVLIRSLKDSAAKVDFGREELRPWKGGVTGWLLSLVGLVVLMAFQNLVLFIVLFMRTWNIIRASADPVAMASQALLPAFLSTVLYSAAVILLTWVRRGWVPTAASALLWIAGPVVSIPAYAIRGLQPGLADLALPSAIAALGTAFLLLTKQSRTVYRCGEARAK